jgi:hypothetical protein
MQFLERVFAIRQLAILLYREQQRFSGGSHISFGFPFIMHASPGRDGRTSGLRLAKGL